MTFRILSEGLQGFHYLSQICLYSKSKIGYSKTLFDNLSFTTC